MAKIDSDKIDRVLKIIGNGLSDVNVLAGVFGSVNEVIDGKKMTNADIEVKLKEADTFSQKEQNRHDEEMARIKAELLKIQGESDSEERLQEYIKSSIDGFNKEYDRYNAMDKNDFLGEIVTARLASLRKDIIELIRELK